MVFPAYSKKEDLTKEQLERHKRFYTKVCQKTPNVHLFTRNGVVLYLWFERVESNWHTPFIEIRIRWGMSDGQPSHEINYRVPQYNLRSPQEYGFDSAFQMLRHYARGLLHSALQIIAKQKVFEYD